MADAELGDETGLIKTDGVDENGVPMLLNEKQQMRYARMWLDNGVVNRKSFQNSLQVLAGIQAIKALGLQPMTALRQTGFANGQFIVFGDIPIAVVRRSKELEWIDEKDLCLEPKYSEEEYQTAEHIMSLSNDDLIEFYFGDKKEAKGARIEALRVRCTPKTAMVYREQKLENNNLDKPTVASSVAMKRRSDDKPIVTFFSKERAEKAGLWRKPGPWTTHPHIMLMRKARNVCIQKGFSDVTHCVATESDIENVPEAAQNQKLRERLERLESERVQQQRQRPAKPFVEPDAVIEMPHVKEVPKAADVKDVKADEQNADEAEARDASDYETEMDISYEDAVRQYEEDAKQQQLESQGDADGKVHADGE
ncbi:MAG: hypothetical protein EOO38_00195 [Cytophagaceae bacterium]|nr:MAG: hypothetical protein EOO38_00195 [Cytophagaceae bacterium]